MTWEASTAVSGIGSYEITIDTTVTTQGASTVLTPEALANGSHTWQVRAKSVAGMWGAKSDAFTFEIDTAAPTKPVNVTPANALTITTNTPTMTWEASTAVSGIGSYEITIDTAVTTQGASTVFTPEALAESSHTWQVRAKSLAGTWGSKSDAFTFTVRTTTPTIDVGSIILKDKGTGNTSYTSQREVSLEAAGIDGTPAQMQISESSTFIGADWITYVNPTVFELSIGDGTKTVYYRLKNGQGTVSKSVNNGITVDTISPTAPTLSKPANGSSTTEAKPQFEWSAASSVAGIGSYEITITGDATVIATQDGSVMTYTPTSNLSNGSHGWKVRAKNVLGTWGSYSETFVLTVASGAVTTPEVVVRVVSETSISTGVGASGTSTINLINSDAIPSKAVFEIIVSDAGGVSQSRVTMSMDGATISPTVISETATQITYRYTPPAPLADGDHSIDVKVTQAGGTTTTKTLSNLKVATATAAYLPSAPVSDASTASPSTAPRTIAYSLSKDAAISIYLYGSNGEMAWNGKYAAGADGGRAGYNAATVSQVKMANGIYVYKIVSDGRVIGKGHVVVFEK